MQVATSYEKSVTFDEVCAEGSTIWQYVREKWKTAPESARSGYDTNFAEELLAAVNKDHPQFGRSYPIVCRYMCQMRQFDAGVFAKWIKKITVCPWKNESTYLDSHADYAVMLFRKLNPRLSSKDLAEHSSKVRQMLVYEHEKMKQYSQASADEVEQIEEMQMEINKSELVEACHIENMENAGTVRIVDTLPELGAIVHAHNQVELDCPISVNICADDLI